MLGPADPEIAPLVVEVDEAHENEFKDATRFRGKHRALVLIASSFAFLTVLALGGFAASRHIVRSRYVGHDAFTQLSTVTRATHPAPGGILCQTLFHPAVHDRHFMSFIEDLGPALSKEFNAELLRQCRKVFTANEWDNMWNDYTGSWELHAVAPHDNAIWASMANWLARQRATQQDGAWPTDSVFPSRTSAVIRTAEKRNQVFKRVMDFGCGDGLWLAGAAHDLGLAQDDAFCVDIVNYVRVPDDVTVLIAPNRAPDYGDYLQQQLQGYNLRGSVSMIASMVTFHHITDVRIRVAALTFIRECLEPDGFFLFGDWDNSGVPIDYTIYMDLTHYLPSLIDQAPTPNDPKEIQLGPLKTEYLSLLGWISLMDSANLTYDEHRSMLPYQKRNLKYVVLNPAEVANRTSCRWFQAVFS